MVDVFFSITNKLRKKCRKKLNDDALRFQVEQPKKKFTKRERERTKMKYNKFFVVVVESEFIFIIIIISLNEW